MLTFGRVQDVDRTAQAARHEAGLRRHDRAPSVQRSVLSSPPTKHAEGPDEREYVRRTPSDALVRVLARSVKQRQLARQPFTAEELQKHMSNFLAGFDATSLAAHVETPRNESADRDEERDEEELLGPRPVIKKDRPVIKKTSMQGPSTATPLPVKAPPIPDALSDSELWASGAPTSASAAAIETVRLVSGGAEADILSHARADLRETRSNSLRDRIGEASIDHGPGPSLIRLSSALRAEQDVRVLEEHSRRIAGQARARMNTAHEQFAEQELAATALAAAYVALVHNPRDSSEKVLTRTRLLVSGRHHRG